jgi:hypothetical protein
VADKKDSKKGSDEELLRVARERFLLAEEAFHDIRKEALDDLEFRAGKQWPDEIKRERETEGRPCLVINRMPQYVRQITNDQRQNRPSIKVSPVDDKADPITAKMFQGLIRHIEKNSNADVAYDTGFEGAAGKGLGYWRVITDYCDPMSFNQEILIKRIRNSFTVYLDPQSKEPDGSDADWGWIFEDIPKDTFKAKYKNAEASQMNDWTSIGDQAPGWFTEKTVRVGEYFYKEFKEVEICLLQDGTVVLASEVGKTVAPDLVINRRKTMLPSIKWIKTNGMEVLERTDWKGMWIPIIPVYGDELDVNGKIIYEGVIRHAKDPQRQYNYFISMETEAIALAPKAPFIAAEGQIPTNYMNDWKTANRKSHAVLFYKPTSLAGQPIAPPQRNSYEPPVMAITNARLASSEDMKTTTGLYDASMGNQGQEVSGVAIQKRNVQAQTSNFHFIDNLTRSLRHTGRILVDLIPHIYDSERSQRIIGEDGQEEVIQLHKMFEYKGEQRKFDFGVGKYDVSVETGPSFTSKRQEAVTAMLEFIRAYPQAAPILGDLLAKNMDWPGAAEIAERLRKLLPPGMADDKEKKDIPPEVQAQMGEMTKMIEALTQKLEEANEETKTKKLELESKERIESMKIERDYTLAKAKLEGEFALATLNAEIAEINRRQGLLNYNEPVTDENSNGSDPEPVLVPENETQPTGGLAPGNYVGEE